MKSEPLVSILICSYNHVHFIQECIESVYKNGYKNIELIVIDDNSNDGSKELLEKLKIIYGFTLHVKPSNRGLVDSINLGIKKYVKGEIYKLLSSDDILLDECIAKAVDEFNSSQNIEVVIGNAISIDANSNKIKDLKIKLKGEINYKNYLSGNIIYNITAAFFKTAIHEKIGFHKEGVISEDIYIFRLIWKHCNVKLVSFYISGYRKHASNKSTDSWLMYQEAIKALKELEGDEYYDIKRRIEYLNFFAGLSKNYKKESLKYFFSSIRFINKRLFWIGVINHLGLNKYIK